MTWFAWTYVMEVLAAAVWLVLWTLFEIAIGWIIIII